MGWQVQAAQAAGEPEFQPQGLPSHLQREHPALGMPWEGFMPEKPRAFWMQLSVVAAPEGALGGCGCSSVTLNRWLPSVLQEAGRQWTGEGRMHVPST